MAWQAVKAISGSRPMTVERLEKGPARDGACRRVGRGDGG